MILQLLCWLLRLIFGVSQLVKKNGLKVSTKIPMEL